MAQCIPLVFERIDLSEEEKMAIQFCHLANDFFHDISGKIYVVPSLRKGRDMDLIVWMHFDKFKPTIETGYTLNPGQENEKNFDFRTKRDVWFNSALLIIELKKHNTQDSISIKNGKLYVKYGDIYKNASDQNFEQLFHLQRFLADRLEIALNKIPRIQNLIWLNRCVEKPIEYDDIDNVIYGEINFKDLLKQLCNLSKPVSFDGGASISFSSCPPELTIKIDAFFEFLGKEKANGLGIISRLKLDRIVNSRLNVESSQRIKEIGQKFLMVKGKPGTGKTFYLLQVAYFLSKEEFKPIILTYNKALSQDLKRLLKYSGYVNTIEIRTIHSFFLQVLKIFGAEEIAESGFTNYESALYKLFQTIHELNGQDIRSILEILFDTVLIDEAQDCLSVERDLILKIFDQENVVVSIGDRQIVRKKAIRWTDNISRRDINLIHLETSHRNKNNLVEFFNVFSVKHFEAAPWDLKENKSLTGGKLHIIPTHSYDIALHLQLTSELIEGGNSMYDLMFLTPNITNEVNYSNNLSALMAKWGIKSFNNSSKENMEAFPLDEHRILNYHSCRGLESWILICWNLDIIIKNIKSAYMIQGEQGEELKNHVNNWLLIIFTRAIDTLVITFDDKSSEEAKLIIELAQSNLLAHMAQLKKWG
jgi:hypothetical protein